MANKLTWTIGGLTREELVKVIPVLAGMRHPEGTICVRLDATIVPEPEQRSINMELSAYDIGEALRPEMVVGEALGQMEKAICKGS